MGGTSRYDPRLGSGSLSFVMFSFIFSQATLAVDEFPDAACTGSLIRDVILRQMNVFPCVSFMRVFLPMLVCLER